MKQLKDSTYRKIGNRHEHRIVAEQKIGRKLLRGEVVHHIDGNKHNNSPENLEVTTQSKHICEHRDELILARKIQASKIVQCPHGHPYSKENTYIFPNGRKHCITCRKKAFHKWKAKKLGLTK